MTRPPILGHAGTGNDPGGDRKRALERSTDMVPVQGTVDLDVPIEQLWEVFRHANLWPRWNRCFSWARNKDLVLGRKLIWCFEPIKPYYLYKLPAVATIAEVEPQSKVTWEVTAFPGMYARHTNHMEALDGGRTRFGSWEQAMGWSFRLLRRFWIAHFAFVKDESLIGAKRLEAIYRRAGSMTEEVLCPARTSKHNVWKWAGLLLALTVVAAMAAGAWGYFEYLRPIHRDLAPGVHAVLGAGGNSVILRDADQTLLIDPKFPPGSRWLRRWMVGHGGPPTVIVDTHYHYDHTQGNPEHGHARIVAVPISCDAPTTPHGGAGR